LTSAAKWNPRLPQTKSEREDEFGYWNVLSEASSMLKSSATDQAQYIYIHEQNLYASPKKEDMNVFWKGNAKSLEDPEVIAKIEPGKTFVPFLERIFEPKEVLRISPKTPVDLTYPELQLFFVKNFNLQGPIRPGTLLTFKN
jgi:hypothetical protein